MTLRPLFAIALFAFLLLAGCAGPGTPTPGEPAELGGACAGGVVHATPLEAVLRTSMGNVTILLATDGAPNTVANFVKLAGTDTYDGVKFHRVIGPSPQAPAGFMIQTGDPLTKDPNVAPERWGTGGTEQIRDEIHPDLQHDGAGIVSMAKSGPNTGSSQFFITLAPARHLDGIHAVFGRVIEGMDVVRAIGNTPTNADGQPNTGDDDRPVEPPVVLDVEIRDANVENAVHAKAILDHKTIRQSGTANFLVLGFNQGTVTDRVRFAVDAPPGWTSTLDVACADLIPGAARVTVVTLQAPAEGTGDATATLRLSGDGEAKDDIPLRVSIGEMGTEAKRGSVVTGNYAGVLENGRLFDTSLLAVAQDPDLPTSSTFRPRSPGQYSPFQFTVGTGVIEGFSKLATGARAGETPAGRIPPGEAYGPAGGGHPLAGKTLLFELEIVAVK